MFKRRSSPNHAELTIVPKNTKKIKKNETLNLSNKHALIKYIDSKLVPELKLMLLEQNIDTELVDCIVKEKDLCPNLWKLIEANKIKFEKHLVNWCDLNLLGKYFEKSSSFNFKSQFGVGVSKPLFKTFDLDNIQLQNSKDNFWIRLTNGYFGRIIPDNNEFIIYRDDDLLYDEVRNQPETTNYPLNKFVVNSNNMYMEMLQNATLVEDAVIMNTIYGRDLRWLNPSTSPSDFDGLPPTLFNFFGSNDHITTSMACNDYYIIVSSYSTISHTPMLNIYNLELQSMHQFYPFREEYTDDSFHVKEIKFIPGENKCVFFMDTDISVKKTSDKLYPLFLVYDIEKRSVTHTGPLWQPNENYIADVFYDSNTDLCVIAIIFEVSKFMKLHVLGRQGWQHSQSFTTHVDTYKMIASNRHGFWLATKNHLAHMSIVKEHCRNEVSFNLQTVWYNKSVSSSTDDQAINGICTFNDYESCGVLSGRSTFSKWSLNKDKFYSSSNKVLGVYGN